MRTTGTFDRWVGNSGRLERAVVTEGWPRPAQVELSPAGVLDYRFDEPSRRIRPGRGMLSGFLKLAEGEEKQILKYARVWGALGKSRLDLISGTPRTYENQFTQILEEIPETTEHWRRTAREMAEVMAWAAEVQDNLAGGSARKSRAATQRVGELQVLIDRAINRLMLLAGVRPQFSWHGPRAGIRFRVDNLLGALAFELALIVSQKEGIGICNACGVPFETDGKRKKYCADCGKQAAWRAASMKRYRARKRARELFERGVTVHEIADLVGRPIHRVRRWNQERVWERSKDVNQKTRSE